MAPTHTRRSVRSASAGLALPVGRRYGVKVYLSYRLWLMGALILPMAACGADASRVISTLDSGYQGSDAASDAGLGGVLTLLSPDQIGQISLVPGEAFEVTVRVSSGFGGPLSGARLEFALLGQPMDATLTELSTTSDVAGEASVYVRAGRTPTTFQLRVYGGGVYSYVSVTVLDTPLVSLPVTVDPRVSAYVASAKVSAYASRTCAGLGETPPSVEVLFGTVSFTANLTGLATGTHYAVVASATDSTGQQTLSGCADIDDPSLLSGITVDFGLNAGGAPSP